MADFKDGELPIVRRLEVMILDEVKRVCEEEGVEFFLVAGTCLGAVRHGGFIPWDDDIDIGMRRADYERFLEVAPLRLKEPYFLQDRSTDSVSPYAYAKVRLRGTRFVEYCNRNVPVECDGVYIDVFPFDEVPDDDEENRRQFEEYQGIIRRFSIAAVPDVSREPGDLRAKARALVRRSVHGLARLTNPDSILNEARKVQTKFNGLGQLAVANLDYPKRKAMYVSLDDLYPLGSIAFEGKEYPVPGNVEAYLRSQYGNWRELPPAEQRVGHRPYIVDLGSYGSGDLDEQ